MVWGKDNFKKIIGYIFLPSAIPQETESDRYFSTMDRDISRMNYDQVDTACKDMYAIRDDLSADLQEEADIFISQLEEKLRNTRA